MMHRASRPVAELAREHREELAATGRLVELEELACRIGDEVTRPLTEQERARRGREMFGKAGNASGEFRIPWTAGGREENDLIGNERNGAPKGIHKPFTDESAAWNFVVPYPPAG